AARSVLSHSLSTAPHRCPTAALGPFSLFTYWGPGAGLPGLPGHVSEPLTQTRANHPGRTPDPQRAAAGSGGIPIAQRCGRPGHAVIDAQVLVLPRHRPQPRHRHLPAVADGPRLTPARRCAGSGTPTSPIRIVALEHRLPAAGLAQQLRGQPTALIIN